MAYAALVSLTQTLDLSLNQDKYSISVETKENLASIKANVVFLQSFLEDFPEKASSYEGKITDVATEMEDNVDFFVLVQIKSRGGFMRALIPGLSRYMLQLQLRAVTQQIGAIVEEIKEKSFRVEYGGFSVSSGAASSSRPEPTLKKGRVIGIHEDDLIAIKDRLCGESSKLEVIPIVGMGGIGKTTLARNAYDDPLIVERFEIRVWVTISQDYSRREILSCLLDSMKLFAEKMTGQKIDEHIMVEKVYKNLKGRRYLIVMDDVWSTKAWDDVRQIFPDDDNWSRIMLTTRLSEVATYADSCSPPHEMQFLDVNQSWDLLKNTAFARGPNSCPPELEYVGKEIARSCRGLPLAVVLVGGILSTITKTQASWEEIAGDVDSIVFDGNIDKILSLSYKYLPQHLKPCFLYFGGFPEDHEIRVSRLIKLWVAEGFLKHHNQYKTWEEEAEEYLEDLVGRNLVLVTSRKSNRKIKSCSLHDLVRSLCLRKAQDEKFLLHVSDRYVIPGNMKNQRRISIFHSDLKLKLGKLLSPNIRTIFRFPTQGCSTVLPFIGSYRLLRVVDAVENSLYYLPCQVYKLFHLRYLAIDFYDDVNIPSSISYLENLQTLIIGSNRKIKGSFENWSLPLQIWSLPQLRHLVFFYPYGLPDPPDGSAPPLENLQTLSTIANLVCGEDILKMIPNLKKLGLVYDVHDDYHLHNLVHLHRLEKLSVNIYLPSLRGLNPVFPGTLRKLTLRGGRFPWGDMTMIGSLPNLEVLKLLHHAFVGDIWETTDGEFPQLRFLLIEESNIEHWITESSHFPRLNRLILHCCRYLREIPDDIGEISALEVIEIDDLNQSLVHSAKQILEDQLSYGNDSLQIRRIHVDQIESSLHKEVEFGSEAGSSLRRRR